MRGPWLMWGGVGAALLLLLAGLGAFLLPGARQALASGGQVPAQADEQAAQAPGGVPEPNSRGRQSRNEERPPVLPSRPSSPTPARVIYINIPSFELELREGGKLLRRYPIAVGAMVTPSVLGWTCIINKVPHPTWYPKGRPPVPPGPENPVGAYWLGLAVPGYGIHGTNQPQSIGTAASGGCIRMYDQDVTELAKLVAPGTPVCFTYETLMLDVQDSGRDVHVTIYPDIYQLGTNNLVRLQQRLAADGLAAWLDPALWQRELALARRIPLPVPVQGLLALGGQELGEPVLWLEGQAWLPVRVLAVRLGWNLLWDAATATAWLSGQAVAGGRILRERLYLPLQRLQPVLQQSGILAVTAQPKGLLGGRGNPASRVELERLAGYTQQEPVAAAQRSMAAPGPAPAPEPVSGAQQASPPQSVRP